MKKIKIYFNRRELIPALIALFFFKPYTTMPRWLEIAYGVVAWIHLAGYFITGYNLLNK